MIGVAHIDAEHIRTGDEQRANLVARPARRSQSSDDLGISAAAHHVSGHERVGTPLVAVRRGSSTALKK